MSGAGVIIDAVFDDREDLAVMDGLLAATGSLKLPFEYFGEYLLLAT